MSGCEKGLKRERVRERVRGKRGKNISDDDC